MRGGLVALGRGYQSRGTGLLFSVLAFRRFVVWL